MYFKPYLVGISGGSASGKTFLLKSLRSAFSSEELTLVSQDNYYKDRNQQTVHEDGTINFDHPNALNLDLFHDHLKLLIEGQSVKIREYHFNNPQKAPSTVEYHPAPIIIVEGLFVMYLPQTRNLVDLKIFVEAEEPIKIFRRAQRDLHERGYSIENTLSQYVKHVYPMYRQYIEPVKHFCDFIIPNNESCATASHVIINHLQTKVNALVQQHEE
ncbi:MAG: uridine kinase [Bacteroidia bacterium]|nr:uridine kinase [Bacteroidia bacterium]